MQKASRDKIGRIRQLHMLRVCIEKQDYKKCIEAGQATFAKNDSSVQSSRYVVFFLLFDCISSSTPSVLMNTHIIVDV